MYNKRDNIMTGARINSVHTATQVILWRYYELRTSTIRNQDTFIYILDHLRVSRC